MWTKIHGRTIVRPPPSPATSSARLLLRRHGQAQGGEGPDVDEDPRADDRPDQLPPPGRQHRRALLRHGRDVGVRAVPRPLCGGVQDAALAADEGGRRFGDPRAARLARRGDEPLDGRVARAGALQAAAAALGILWNRGDAGDYGVGGDVRARAGDRRHRRRHLLGALRLPSAHGRPPRVGAALVLLLAALFRGPPQGRLGLVVAQPAQQAPREDERPRRGRRPAHDALLRVGRDARQEGARLVSQDAGLHLLAGARRVRLRLRLYGPQILDRQEAVARARADDRALCALLQWLPIRGRVPRPARRLLLHGLRLAGHLPRLLLWPLPLCR